VLQLDIHDISDLGGLFYQWEIAVALACSILQVNPFDQPDVQDSKTRTQAKIDGIRQGQPLAQKSPAWTRNGVNLYADIRETKENVNSLSALILEILTGQGKAGDYIAINAYLPRNDATFENLQKFRKEILEKTRKANHPGLWSPLSTFYRSTAQGRIR